MSDNEYDGVDSRVIVADALQCMADDVFENGALLTGWVAVMEWVTADGNRYLSSMRADNTPAWQVKGMLHESLFGGWMDDDYEDDE